MSEQFRRLTPQEVITFSEDLMEVLSEMGSGSCAGCVPGFAQSFLDCILHLKREAANRGIATDRLLDLQVAWNKLTTRHPDIAEAMKHFGDFITPSVQLGPVYVLDQLKIRAHEELAVAASSGTLGTGQPEQPQGYTSAWLQVETGASKNTVNKAAKGAEVKTPQRGKRNHRYTKAETQRILQRMINTSSDHSIVSACKKALEMLV